ncbi:Limulus clotting factor C [Eumeta japonica]|uniref:Limulus clotting factor C n=1 Tax=Eumeta variegata TaxID=151549 RepID=A0A4C1VKP4_EUMVA|nr:Limulus clotting factor C [Eumeta japonica]
MGPGYNKQSLIDLYANVVGFGLTENGTLSNVLKHTTVKIQSDATCLLSDTVYQKLLNEFNFCAGNGPNSNANPCNGDSGGGLVIEYDFGGSKHWVIQGITSVAKSRPSTNQCDPTQYVVYTAVTPYYQWIMGHL